MIKPRFYLVDDDPSIRRILSHIIEDHDLGHIVGLSDCGITAVEEIANFQPDIALVDLLLPDLDGINVVKMTNEAGLNIQFIMISEVSTKDMIGLAYESGIDAYIYKPINVVEVVSVIKKTIETRRLRQVLKQIRGTVNRAMPTPVPAARINYKNEVRKIFAEIGIVGEKGSTDIMNIIEIISTERMTGQAEHNYSLSDLYKKLTQRYEANSFKISKKAIEQRVRRTIQTALRNVASIGIEDFSNAKFERYSTSLFGFHEVRQEMAHIKNHLRTRGKINVRKFIEGIISLTQAHK